MTVADIAVLIGAAAAIALLGWYFFGPRKTHTAAEREGIQQVEVTVKGGYSPDVVRVRQGVPVRMVFDRQESGECTSQVVFADLGIRQSVPAFGQTTVEFTPQQPGRLEFACGMNMVHGAVLVEPSGDDGPSPVAVKEPSRPTEPEAAGQDDTEDAGEAEEAARRAEVADLTRRVVLGAVLTAPVVLAVMLHEFFDVAVPGLLLNRGGSWR